MTTRLHTLSVGAAGPRIAFLHGLFGQGRNWNQVAKALAGPDGTGARCLLIDLPDHGRSPWTAEFSFEAYADAVAATLRAAAPGESWTLVGHSLGNEFKVRDRQTGLIDEGPFIEVDYIKNAQSFGLKTWFAEDEAGLEAALKAARRETVSCMIVVPTERYRGLPSSEVWWEVVGAEVTEDPVTRALVDAREEGRAKQRLYC